MIGGLFMKEFYYDKLLNIHTRGKQEENILAEDLYYFPYEPTPYRALDTFVKHYKIKKGDRIVDFGSGKGRLPFFLHHTFHVPVLGVEMDQGLYEKAIQNRKGYEEKYKVERNAIQFFCGYAEEYEILPSDNRFYFFNPFSIPIFKKVIQNIMKSFERSKREIELILYYGSKEYLSFLDEETPFVLKDEIRVPFQYYLDSDERFLIYGL